jgi:polar amino acid transport system substrate-binding protein
MFASRHRIFCLVRSFVCLLAVLIGSTVPLRARAEGRSPPDTALTRLLDGARAELPATCSEGGVDRLARILCAQHIRIGVRLDYPQFAELDGGRWRGYEIDLARAIARRLGVAAVFVPVTPANRIALLAEDRIDLAIATIGDNTQRDGQARFIRPHYYQSETVLVGRRDLAISGWDDITGKTVCVTVGNGSNAELSSHGARLMLFGNPEQLLDELRNDTCSLVAQDDSFFSTYLAKSEFASRYAIKLGFAPVPWGMAVALGGTERLARGLALMSQIFDRDGVLLALARANHIATEFLRKEQDIWREPACDTESGSTDQACILPPLNAELKPTAFANRVSVFETWLASRTGLKLSLPMFKTVAAWSLLRSGVINSLVLVAGTIVATLAVALAFGALLGARSPALHWPMRLIVVTLQSLPPVMALVIAATVAETAGRYSSSTLIAAAIAALSMINGANAGQAISEAIMTLRAETGSGRPGGSELFILSLGQSAKQIEAFTINAVKGTPIASFIGTPELLNALTDITSFSSERVTTYWLLMVFYIVIVMMVVRLCAMFRWFLQRRGAWV